MYGRMKGAIFLINAAVTAQEQAGEECVLLGLVQTRWGKPRQTKWLFAKCLRCRMECRQISDEFGNLVLWVSDRCGHSKAPLLTQGISHNISVCIASAVAPTRPIDSQVYICNIDRCDSNLSMHALATVPVVSPDYSVIPDADLQDSTPISSQEQVFLDLPRPNHVRASHLGAKTSGTCPVPVKSR